MMISIKTTMWVLVILSLISIGTLKVKAAESPEVAPEAAGAPGPGSEGSDCMNQLFNMSDCLDFVTQGSNATKPEIRCCPELAGMLDSNPLCLCQLFAKSKDFGNEIDMKKALELPSVCKLQTPDISLCSVVSVPVAAPTILGGSPMSSEDGISPSAEEATGRNNGASSNATFNVVAYLIISLSMAFTLLKV